MDLENCFFSVSVINFSNTHISLTHDQIVLTPALWLDICSKFYLNLPTRLSDLDVMVIDLEIFFFRLDVLVEDPHLCNPQLDSFDTWTVVGYWSLL